MIAASYTADAQELEPLPLREIGRRIALIFGAAGAFAWLWSAGILAALVQMDPGAITQPGFALFAALAIAMQFLANHAASAIKQADALRSPLARNIALGLLIVGGAVNAFSFHHFLEVCGLVAPFAWSADWLAANAWQTVMAVGVAVCEPAVYWLDEHLRAGIGAAKTQCLRAHRADSPAAALQVTPERVSLAPPKRPRLLRTVAGATLGLGVGASAALAEEPPAIVERVDRADGADAGNAGRVRARHLRGLAREQAKERAMALLMLQGAKRNVRAVASETGLNWHAVNDLARSIDAAERLSA